MFKLKWRLAGLIVGAGLLVAVLLLILVHTPPARRYALQQLEHQLAAQDIRLDAGQISYNLVSGSATLSDVRLSSAHKPDLPPFLTAREINVDVGLLSLFRGMIHLEQARLDRVSVHWIATENGRTNLPDIPEKKIEEQEGGLPEFLISRLQINQLSVLIDDRQQGLRVELPEGRLSITGRTADFSHQVEFALSKAGQAQVEGRSIPISDIKLDARLPGNLSGATIDELALRTDSSTLRLAGLIEGLADPQLDLSSRAHLDVRQISESAQLSEPVQGTVDLEAALKGTFDKLKVEGRLQGRQLAVRELADVAIDAGFRWDQNTGNLEIASLNLQSPLGRATGRVELALAVPGTSSADLELERFDLGRLLKTLDSPVLLETKATGRIHARWQQLEIENAAGEAEFRLAATAAHASRNTVPVSGHVSLQLEEQTPEPRAARIRFDSVRFPGFETSGRLNLTSLRDLTSDPKADLSGGISGKLTDLHLLAKNLEAFNGTSGESSIQDLRLRGAAELAGLVRGTLARPALSLQLNAPSVSVADFDEIRLSAQAEITADEVRVTNAVAAWRAQSADVNGTVNLAAVSPLLDLTATVTAGDIAEIMAGLDVDVPIKGRGRVVAAVEGAAANPQAQFSVEVTGIEAYQESLGTLTIEGSLADRIISIKEMALHKASEAGGSEGTLTATGSYELDSNAYQVHVSSQNLRVANVKLSGGVPVSAGLALEADGAGTVENPRLSFKLQSDDLKVLDREMGRVSVAGQIQNRQGEVTLEAPSLNLTGSGRVGLDAPYPAEAQIKADRLDLSKLPIALAERPLEGFLTAQLTAAGSAQTPMDGQAELRVGDISVRLSGQEIENQEPFEVDYANHQISLSPTTLALGASYLTLEGRLPVAALGEEGGATPRGFDITQKTRHSTAAAGVSVKASINVGQMVNTFFPSAGFTAAGNLNLDGLIAGNIPNINPAFRLSLQDGSLRASQLAEPVQEVNLSVSIENGAVAVESLSARLGPGNLALAGTIPLGILPFSLPASILRSDGPADLRGKLSGFSLQSISGVPSDVSGTVSVSFQAQSSSADINSVAASVRLDQLDIRVAGIALEQEVPGLLTLQNGQARVERFALTGPETRIEAGGTAQIVEPGTLDLRADGRMDLSLLAVFGKDLAASGASQFQVAVGGTTSNVRATGYWSVDEGQLTVQEPGLQLTDLGARVELAGNRAVIRKFEGNLNGGHVQLDGEAGFAEGALQAADLRLKARGIFLELPEGLQTASNADLALTTRGGPIDVSGRIEVLEGSYTDPVNLEEELLGLVAAPSESMVSTERDPLLSRVRLNINVASRDPIVMDNNLARIAGDLDLRLVGDPYSPSLLGRLTLEEGGELYLRERTYYLERGLISFYNPSAIEPSLDLAAKTQVQNYEITLRISGEPGNLETSLTSEDPLPEPDIIALLVTGRTLEEVRGEASAVLREQTLSLLTGTVTGRLERGLEQATGLSKVRIQPSLIAAESDPSARLTVGQDLTRQLGLIYSMDLTNGSDQIYIGEYDVSRSFTARVIYETAPEGEVDPDAKYRFEVRHDLRMGGGPQTGGKQEGQEEKRRITSIKVQAGGPFSETELLKQFGLEAGDRYDFFRARRGLTRLNDFLHKQGYLEGRVRSSREEPNPEAVELSLQVEPGSKVEFAYQGAQTSDEVKDRVRAFWIAGVFDAQRIASAQEAIRNQLIEEGFLEPQITHRVDVENAVKRVVFAIEPGTRYTDIGVGFQGVQAFPEEQLREQLRSAGLLGRVGTASAEVNDLLKRMYRQEGYLAAEIRDPVRDLHPENGQARILIPIVEGPRAVITQIAFNGNQAISGEQLLSTSGLQEGQVYQPRSREQAIARLQALYASAGYSDAAIEASLDAAPETGQGRLVFALQEKRREVVREVRIEGNRQTSDGFVRNQLAFGPGDALTPDSVARTRRSLYNTGAYALVEIDREEIETQAGSLGEKPVRAIIRVQEVRPYRLQYGGFYDTERGLGFISDLTNRNTLGNAATLGLRGRYDDEFREIRVYYSQPQLAGLPFDTNISTFLSRDVREAANFAVDRAGFSLQQQKEFRNRFVLSYGYRFERDHSYDIGPDPFFDLTLKVGRLLANVVRDVRDDILDASRGSFISQSVEYAPKWVGSDLAFGRYFGQYFQYIPLSEPSEIPWGGGLRKSRLVYAGGIRVGLAQAYAGQGVVRSERFFAGGGTSIRGFEQDTIGPRNVIGEPAGGEAVFILNNELRFPLLSIFDGVGFLDVGNVYREIKDFDPFDVRGSAGFGLRIRTPYFLLRADYGLKLNRQPDESRGAFFFSIGQAF